jgi:hypothetical protein
MAEKPKVMTSTEKELDKVEKQFEAFDDSIKKMTLDRMNEAPREETEMQTKMCQNEIAKSKDIYLKPLKTVSCREKFNENFRATYEYDKEYVQFIAEHKELIGEKIEKWTKPFAGVPAEYWEVPTNKPVWGPRYLAEEIKRCSYHRLKMDQATLTAGDGYGQYYGAMAVDTIVQRLDAHPVTKRKSLFMGASGF